MNPSSPPRLPDLVSGAELRRWYWLRSELAAQTRALGLDTSGSKRELTDRLAAVLDGQQPAAVTRRSAPRPQLDGPLDDLTVIPPGQRCSQRLREFFIARIGPGFRFDQAMREFIAEGAGQTLGAAVRHWQLTRSDEPREIEPQFEYNRFTRAWHQDHPGGSRADLIASWRRHKALPADLRPTQRTVDKVHG